MRRYEADTVAEACRERGLFTGVSVCICSQSTISISGQLTEVGKRSVNVEDIKSDPKYFQQFRVTSENLTLPSDPLISFHFKRRFLGCGVSSGILMPGRVIGFGGERQRAQEYLSIKNMGGKFGKSMNLKKGRGKNRMGRSGGEKGCNNSSSRRNGKRGAYSSGCRRNNKE